MKATDIMRQPVLATTPWARVEDVLFQLVSNDISGMPVTEHDGTVVGIVTENDILRTFVEGAPLDLARVQDIMSTDLVTVNVETPLEEVMQTIYDAGILRVPVLENGRVVGIISRSDLIKALVQSGPLSDPGFLMFHRDHQDDAYPDLRPTTQAHPVYSDGW